jgi:hypothetical protein
MTEPIPFRYRRGRRYDLHITSLRTEAEKRYGRVFTDTVALGNLAQDPEWPDISYDAVVASIVCTALITIRPLPAPVRFALTELLAVETDKRASTIQQRSGRKMIELRSDAAAIHLMIDTFGSALYPEDSYLRGLNDIACGLEGLKLTWSRDIISEVQPDGQIPLDALRRISLKLHGAIESDIHNGRNPRCVIIGAKNGDNIDPITKRRLYLITLVDRAISLSSTLTCIPASERENRFSIGTGTRPEDDSVPLRRSGIRSLS